MENENIFLMRLIGLVKFVKKNFLILSILIISGGVLGYCFGYFKKPIYSSTLNFAMEDDKASGGGLAGAMGLATTLGIDLGSSAGGAFSGNNLMVLIKSRSIVERVLLTNVLVDKKEISLADFYIDFKKLKTKWKSVNGVQKINFNSDQPRETYSILQDSLLGVIYEEIAGLNGTLSVYQNDKKISIISINVKSENEYFAKYFVDILAKEVSEFYIDSKSKKARNNVRILQKQSDSVRAELNNAISGVASANDNVYNLNSALNVKRTPSLRKQVDVQANTAILTQLVTNLEMAKVTLLKETPLIQIIDKPILPLPKDKVSKLKYSILGSFIFTMVYIFFIFFRIVYQKINDQITTLN